jgi:two-component system response regulator (stage 0 sporulation protein F)
MEKKDITILYVDDEQVNLRIFEINFRKRYNVITAVSGEQGLEKLEENGDIIVVVSDMKMPGMNGIEFIKKAREKIYPCGLFYSYRFRHYNRNC